MAVYLLGDKACLKKQFDNKAAKEIGRLPEGKIKNLVEGNQEDIDLVIATGQDIILIEVKAYGAFTDLQIDSKVARLKLLSDFYNTCKDDPGVISSDRTIRFHAALMSPNQSNAHADKWSSWLPSGHASQAAPIILELASDPPILTVSRCAKSGNISAINGDHWCVAKH